MSVDRPSSTSMPGEEGVRQAAAHCACGRILRGMMRPCLLMLIMEGEAQHGYELHDGLIGMGLDLGDDMARVYRALRRLEEQGLLTSEWDTSGSGPARRLYHITEDGRRFLEEWQHDLETTRKQLAELSSRLAHLI